MKDTNELLNGLGNCNVVEVDVADSFNIETDFAEVQNGTLPC